MKAKLRPGPEDGPEREALQAFLRQWDVGGPPPDLEEDLRRAFRRRRSGRRPVVWLALAAGLALVALYQGVSARRPAPAGPSVVVASPHPAPLASPASGPTVAPPEVPAAPALPTRVRRVPVPSPAEPEVIVEPNQAELLAQLGRELPTVQAEAPATSAPRVEVLPADVPEAPIPQMEPTDVPTYRATWEAVEGEWPFVHRSVPGSGR
jgi:hypothetical protein